MPSFMSVHRAPGLSAEEFQANGAEVLEEKYAKVVHIYANLLSGFIVNIYDAESRDELVREFERVGFPYEEIQEIQFSVDRAGLEQMVGGA